ncbi:MAG: hypothetical protein IT361_08045 [Gemmatimonadaceae bacterium]|nr:hypothetical protein [Gemmatimonadaceae bacterium]
MALTPRHLLVVTVPACLIVGFFGARAVGDVASRNANAVLATLAARSTQQVRFPEAGEYWVFAAGSQDAMKASSTWAVRVTHDALHADARVARPESRRARDRENRAALDLLFTIRVDVPGTHTVRLTPDSVSPGDVQLRITRFDRSNAGAAMRAFGLAALFSVLLVLNGVLVMRATSS